MNAWIDIFKVFEEYKGIAPTNLSQIEQLEQECRQKGFESIADYLWEWRTSLEYHIYREFDDSLSIEEANSFSAD